MNRVFNLIQQNDSLTGDILSLANQFDPQAISKTFIMNIMNYWEETDGAGRQTSASRLTKAFGALKAFSFISQEKNKFHMRRLVQLDKLAELAEHALMTMSNAYSYGEYGNLEICQ
ncbi:hypothetical protein Ct61P_14832 [Colletotrichum tofieldiae]|nr:hypothetical protein Ct61P_14832 [Colletotrichum tofieldiae]